MATSVQDFIKANPNYIGYANTANRAKPKEAPKSKKGSGRLGKTGLSAWISELGGAGGAIGGAATGAALGSVVPGIGNIVGGVIGGIAGGFAGGTGGRLAENQLRDNEYRLGDALKEGAVSGAFGGVGPAFQGVRGLGALGKASGAKFGAKAFTGAQALSGISDDAARAAAGKAISQGGKRAGKAIAVGSPNLSSLQIAGRGLSENAIGIGQGVKAPGAANLGAGQSDDLLKTLTKDLGLPRTNPERMQRALEPIIRNKGTELANIYKGSTVKYSASQLKSAADDIARTLADDASFQPSKAVNQQLSKQLNLLTKAKTPQEVWKIQKDLGKSINFGKNADAKLVDREAVARVVRERLGTLLDEAVPDAKATKTLYSKAMTADELLRIASKPADKTGLVARIGTSGAFRNAEAKTGGLVEALGGRGVANTARLATGAGVRGVANQAMAPIPQDTMQDPLYSEQYVNGGTLTPDALYGPTAGQVDPMQMGGGLEEPTQSPYTLQQALAEAYQLAPNASESELLSYAKALQAETKGTQLTAQEKKSAKQAETALQGLNQLKSLYTNAGGGQNRLPGILGNVQGKLGANSEAEAYNKIRDSLTTSLARAFGETGVLTDQDREVYKQALPRLEDTPEEAQIKLQYLEDMLAESSRSYGETDYGTQADLSSLISQYGGQ